MHWTLALIVLALVWAGAAYWRPLSLALVAAWMAGQVWWMVTGDMTPVHLYLVLDIAIIAIGLWALSCWQDMVILAMFPFAWEAYFWTDDVARWWYLWGIMVAQLSLAGPWPKTQKIGGAVSHGSLKDARHGVL